jgi:hypothetical protein
MAKPWHVQRWRNIPKAWRKLYTDYACNPSRRGMSTQQTQIKTMQSTVWTLQEGEQRESTPLKKIYEHTLLRTKCASYSSSIWNPEAYLIWKTSLKILTAETPNIKGVTG